MAEKMMNKKSSDTSGTSLPLILAVETSGRLGSVALAQGPQLLAEKVFTTPMRHSAELFPAVNELLEKYDRKTEEIEQIYVSVGPGSFTGLRIAVTMAKTMNLAIGSKIVAVDTLDVIACNASAYVETCGEQIGRIGVILDAKRSEFFAAVYEDRGGKWEKVGEDQLVTSDEFISSYGGGEGIWLLGEGLVYYKDKFAASGIEFLDEQYWNPSAANVHKLGWEKSLRGEFADAAGLVPNYMRRAMIGEKK